MFGVHLGPFRYCTKLGAKWAKLVQLIQKLVQRSCVVIFRNEGTLSTPLDPKLMFWYISLCLHASRTISLLHKTRCKTGRTGAINAKFLQRSHIAILHKEHTRCSPLDPKLIFGAFRSVCVHLGLLRYRTELGAKRAE